MELYICDMNAEELRLGNYVFCLETNSLQRITGLTSEMPFIDAITFDYPNYDEIEAIPLTEEWLLRLGFELCSFGNVGLRQYRLGDRLIVIREGKFVDYGSSVVLEYVHTLQNFFYALTKQDLEFKTEND